jgi:hypothetical protein
MDNLVGLLFAIVKYYGDKSRELKLRQDKLLEQWNTIKGNVYEEFKSLLVMRVQEDKAKFQRNALYGLFQGTLQESELHDCVKINIYLNLLPLKLEAKKFQNLCPTSDAVRNSRRYDVLRSNLSKMERWPREQLDFLRYQDLPGFDIYLTSTMDNFLRILKYSSVFCYIITDVQNPRSESQIVEWSILDYVEIEDIPIPKIIQLSELLPVEKKLLSKIFQNQMHHVLICLQDISRLQRFFESTLGLEYAPGNPNRILFGDYIDFYKPTGQNWRHTSLGSPFSLKIGYNRLARENIIARKKEKQQQRFV